MYIVCMREYKAITLAVSLGPVLNWTPCIPSIAWRRRGKPQQIPVRADILKRNVTDEYKVGVPSPVSGTSQPYLDFHSDSHTLTFIGPCIVIYFYSKTNKMHQFFKFILFCSSILHVSDGLSVHHQESKTVHTASGICQTDSADCLLAGTRWNWCCMYSLRLLMMDGKTVRNV
jgi:hypothetical protein